MKVYLATSGEYSDYTVVHVFARREDAETYKGATDVEEFEVHEGPIEMRVFHALSWRPSLPDSDDPHGIANLTEWGYKRDFDGHERTVTHQWQENAHYGAGRYGPSLTVYGWDLERVRKVYSEQRAQYIANRDAGTVP